MAKFKKGDRVRYDGRGLCSVEAGTLCEIDQSGDTCPNYHTLEGEPHNCAEHESHFELVTNGETTHVGDLLVNEDGYVCRVLAVCGGVYGLSENGDSDDHEAFDCWMTQKDLDKNGWKLKTDETIEKSVSDLEQELNMQPGTLRIKKEGTN